MIYLTKYINARIFLYLFSFLFCFSSQMEPSVFYFGNLPVRNPDDNDADTEGFCEMIFKPKLFFVKF